MFKNNYSKLTATAQNSFTCLHSVSWCKGSKTHSVAFRQKVHLLFPPYIFQYCNKYPQFLLLLFTCFWYDFVFFSFETRFHCTTDADLDVSFSCLGISNTEIISVCTLQFMYLYMIDSWEWEWEAKKEFKKLSDLIVKTEFSRSTVSGCLVFIFF